MIREREYGAVSGGAVLVGLLTVGAFLFWQFVVNVSRHSPGMAVACVVGLVFTVFLLTGLFVVNPNEARVLQLFGKYVGTREGRGPAVTRTRSTASGASRSACGTSRAAS